MWRCDRGVSDPRPELEIRWWGENRKTDLDRILTLPSQTPARQNALRDVSETSLSSRTHTRETGLNRPVLGFLTLMLFGTGCGPSNRTVPGPPGWRGRTCGAEVTAQARLLGAKAGSAARVLRPRGAHSRRAALPRARRADPRGSGQAGWGRRICTANNSRWFRPRWSRASALS